MKRLQNKPVRVLLWTVAWLGLLAVAMEYVIAGGFLWRVSSLEKYFLRRQNDHWVHNAFQMSSLKNRTKTQQEEVLVFLGGSIGLSAIYSDSRIGRRLTRLTGKKMTFRSLCSSYQTFADKAKIVEGLGGFDGTILIALDPPVFRKNAQLQLETVKNRVKNKYFFLTLPPGIREILSKNGVETSLKHRFRFPRTAQVFGELIRRNADRRHWRQFAYKKYSRDKKPVPKNRNLKPKLGTKFYGWFCDYRKNVDLNLDLLKETIRIAHSHGNRVILLNLPTCPGYDAIISMYNPHYNRMIRRLVRERNVGYVDLRKAAPWENSDFNDIHHLRIPGRKKLAKVLAAKLATYLPVMEELYR